MKIKVHIIIETAGTSSNPHAKYNKVNEKLEYKSAPVKLNKGENLILRRTYIPKIPKIPKNPVTINIERTSTKPNLNKIEVKKQITGEFAKYMGVEILLTFKPAKSNAAAK